jgi:tetraacyldisaccharide-1-P 4'-kinase
MDNLSDVKLAGVAHYSDHHAFSHGDLKAWQRWGQQHEVRDLLVTKKDAVRIVPLMIQLPGWNLWEIPLAVAWDDEAKLNSWLDSLVETLP